MSEALAARALGLLSRRRLTLAVAEASTCGLLSHLLTEVPGSSAVFLGGVVPYHNQLKERLGVSPALLAARGAVSEEAATALAQSVREWAGADIGLSITGIAGPGGGTAEKPVGLTYISLATAGATLCQRFVFSGDRTQNKRSAAASALDLLIRYLSKEEGDGHTRQ